MAKAVPNLLAARESFVCELGGVTYDIREGELIEADHPLVGKFPDHFLAPHLRFPVERRAEAPSQKRGA